MLRSTATMELGAAPARPSPVRTRERAGRRPSGRRSGRRRPSACTAASPSSGRGSPAGRDRRVLVVLPGLLDRPRRRADRGRPGGRSGCRRGSASRRRRSPGRPGRSGGRPGAGRRMRRRHRRHRAAPSAELCRGSWRLVPVDRSSSSTRHWNEPTSIGPGDDLGPRRRAGERRPAAVGLGAGARWSWPSASAQDLGVAAPSGRRACPRRSGYAPANASRSAAGRRLVAQRRPAEQLLGRDPRQVDARVGVDQADAVVRAVGDELAVRRQRLGEPAVLERQVAQQVERVVAPRAAEGLLDHPPRAARGRGRPPPGDTSARPGASTRDR